VDDVFGQVILGNALSRWIVAIGTCAAVVIALWVIKRAAVARAAKVTAHTRTPYDDVLVRVIEQTSFVAMLGAGVAIGVRTLELPPEASLWIGRALFAVLVIQAGLWITNFVTLAFEKRREHEGEAPHHRTMTAAVGFFTRLVVWSIVLLSILSNVGVEVSTLIAGLGIGGLAAALAVQNVLGELVAAFSIYSDRPIDVGDLIEIDDFKGTVERIGWRTTHLRGLGGEQIIIANSDLAKSRIRNYKRMQERRVVLTFGVEYSTPHEALAAIPGIVRDVLGNVDKTRFERAHLAKLGESSVDFEIAYWVLDPDYAAHMERQHQLLLGLKQRLDEMDVGFAFPTRTIHVYHHGDAREGADDDALTAT
jgi:small-conductance mechanosensitive channel